MKIVNFMLIVSQSMADIIAPGGVIMLQVFPVLKKDDPHREGAETVDGPEFGEGPPHFISPAIVTELLEDKFTIVENRKTEGERSARGDYAVRDHPRVDEYFMVWQRKEE